MPLKDEQIVVSINRSSFLTLNLPSLQIIAPGSKTTLAQLGIQESIAPAQLRIRSCMFPAEKDGEWEPYKVLEKPVIPRSRLAGVENSEVQEIESQEPEVEYYEDFQSEEDAVWPLAAGRIVHWPCFFALLTYCHKRLSPHLHSPILLVAQPCWTIKDYEKLTQFFFEKFKPPGFIIVDSALTSLWSYNVVNACVVDVGYEKADITAIVDFAINIPGRGIAISHTGGEAFTSKLLELLKSKGFNHDMAEQLKQSSICEILPADVPLPSPADSSDDQITNPAAAVSTGAVGSGSGQRHTAGALGEAPLGPGPGTEVGEEGKDDIEQDGVLDVASIVAAGNKKMEEFLARKDKEKHEKGAKKGRSEAAPAATKQSKLRNVDKARATFTYEVAEYQDDDNVGTNGTNGTANGETVKERRKTIVKKEVEVGLERFQAASGGTIERIADAVHIAISSVDDVSKRSEVWDNLIVVGNGARIKGVPCSYNSYHIQLTLSRFQRGTTGCNSEKVYHLTIISNNFHLRTTLTSHNPYRYWSQYASASV
jgi:actin-related protein 9